MNNKEESPCVQPVCLSFCFLLSHMRIYYRTVWATSTRWLQSKLLKINAHFELNAKDRAGGRAELKLLFSAILNGSKID